MVPCFVEVTSTLLEIWKGLPPEPVNIHTFMTKVTLDVIGTTRFAWWSQLDAFLMRLTLIDRYCRLWLCVQLAAGQSRLTSDRCLDYPDAD